MRDGAAQIAAGIAAYAFLALLYALPRVPLSLAWLLLLGGVCIPATLGIWIAVVSPDRALTRSSLIATFGASLVIWTTENTEESPTPYGPEAWVCGSFIIVGNISAQAGVCLVQVIRYACRLISDRIKGVD